MELSERALDGWGSGFAGGTVQNRFTARTVERLAKRTTKSGRPRRGEGRICRL